jgi:prevent-host-death family protein
MTETGIRDLKTHLSSYLRQVEDGQTVVITRHGNPIARIVPVTKSTEAQLDRLRQAGLIAWNEQKLQPSAPVAQARGERTVADLLLEDRE